MPKDDADTAMKNEDDIQAVEKILHVLDALSKDAEFDVRHCASVALNTFSRY